jgi:hypothetical protein
MVSDTKKADLWADLTLLSIGALSAAVKRNAVVFTIKCHQWIDIL